MSTELSTTTDQDVLSSMRLRFKAAEEMSGEWRQEASELFDLDAGRQWDEADKAQRDALGLPSLSFNLISKYIDAVSGLQIANRLETRFIGREIGDVKVNEILTAAADWSRDRCQAYIHESWAWRDMLVCGLGVIETYIDTDDDPEGMLRIERRDPLEIYIDPSARMPNKIDARYMIRVRRMPFEELEERWPGKADNITRGDSGMGIEPFDDAGGLYLNAMGDGYHRNGLAGSDRERRLVTVADYQWYERSPKVRIFSDMGQRDMTAAQWNKMQPMLDDSGVSYKIHKFNGKTYFRKIVTNNVVLEGGESPYQGGFTYGIMAGKVDRNRSQNFGLGRPLAEPQKFVNKILSESVHILSTQAKGGLLAEEDAFVDPKRAEAQWAQADSIVWMEQGAIAGGKIMPKPISPVPAGFTDFLKFAMQALPETSGLNLEIMGMTNKVQAGVVEAQRKQSAMTMLQWAFDAMKNYCEYNGKQIAAYTRDYLSDGRLIRITGDQGDEQFIQLLKDDTFMDFDVIVDESPTSANMKERTFGIMMEMLPIMQQTGMGIPPEFWENSPLPSQLGKALADAARGNPEEKQKQAQMQEAMAQAELQLQQASAAEKQASAQEKGARAQIDMQKMQLDGQKMQVEQHKLSLDAKRLEVEVARMQSEQAASVLEVDKVRAEINEKRAKTDLLQQEAEAQAIENTYFRHGKPMPNNDPEIKAKFAPKPVGGKNGKARASA